jgi:hypothetical protein
MIVMHILAFILLFALSVAIVLLFSLFIENIIYYALVLLTFFIWSRILGFVFFSNMFGMLCFLVLTIVYVVRVQKLKNMTSELPIVIAEITTRPAILNCKIIVSLSLLKLCKYLPAQADAAISKKLNFNTSIYELVKIILTGSKETSIHIKDKNNNIKVYIK